MQTAQSEALLRLFDEVPILFRRLKSVAGEIHGRDIPSAGHRGIMRSLESMGPQSVPQLARARPVSRQHIQTLVNGLIENGLVVAEQNPANRKSPLLRLTVRGSRRLQTIQAHELQLLSSLRFESSAKEIDLAWKMLRSLSELLQGKEWSAYVASNR